MTKDGTEERQDSSVATQDASKGKQGTPKETPDFTKDTQAKAVSDALATAGRTAKAFETREQALQGGLQVLKDAEIKAEEKRKVAEAKELEDAEGDKDEQSRIKRRQAFRVSELSLKQEREEFTKEKAANQADIDAAKATRFETDVFEIATKRGVDADKLKTLATKLGITDLEQVEELAKASSKEGIGPDPGGTIGGGEKTKEQRLKERYPTM